MRKRSFFLRSVPEEILQEPDARLWQQSIPVESIDKEVQQASDTMMTVLKKLDSRWHPFRIFNTLGLAAPQIGYTKRVFILRKRFGTYDVFINPEIIQKKWVVPVIESCLSVQNLHVVSRYLWIKIQYESLKKEKKEQAFFGPQAVLVQQEIDHLNGKLISDYGNR